MNTLTLSCNEPTPDRSIAAAQAFERANAAADGQDGALISAERDEPEPAHWSSARKPFWWAFFATVVISAIGSTAIYFIHRTTPATPAGAQIATSAKAKTASAIDPGSSASPSAASAPVLRNSVGTAESVAVRNKQTGAGETAAATLNTNAVQAGKTSPNTTGGVSKSATANPPPSPSTATISTPARPTAKSSEQSIQWSATNGRAESVKSENQAANSKAKDTIIDPNKGSAKGPSQDPNRVPNTDSAKTANNANSKAEAKPAAKANTNESAPSFAPSPVKPAENATNAQRRDAPTNAPVAVAGSTANATTGAASGRLRATQDTQCGDANFFQRLVCDERVKQRFCRDRWNDHQDCALQKPRDL